MNYLKHCANSTKIPTLLFKKKPTPLVIKLLKGEAFIDDRASMLQHTISSLYTQGYMVETEYDFGVTFKKGDHLILVAEHTSFVAGYCYYLPDEGFNDLTIITASDQINTYDFTKESVNKIVSDLCERPHTYTIGSHCDDCPYEYECLGIHRASQNAVAKLNKGATGVVIDSYSDYVLAKKAVDAYKKVLDKEIEKHGILKNDQYTIQKVRQERLVIPAFKAVEYMVKQYPDATKLLEDVTITKGAVETFIKSKMERGDKKVGAEFMIMELKGNGIAEVKDTFVTEVTELEPINK